jgi:FtsZ-interacting cell division protein ZipA
VIISELQLNLIVAGGLAVAGVWGYNIWQERKYRKAAEQIFREQQQDVLAPEQQSEPVYGRDLTAEAPAEDQRVEPVFSVPADEPAPAAQAAEPDETLADAMIELIVPIHVEQAIAAERLLDLAAGLAGRLSARLRWVVRDAALGWAALEPSDLGAYRQLRAVVPLADRQGALTEAEFATLLAACEALAATRGGEVERIAAVDCLAKARALDELCASVDVQVAVHVIHRSGESFSTALLYRLTEAAGLTLAADGSFYCRDDAGAAQFSLANHGAAPFVAAPTADSVTPGITFWLDVPRVSDGAQIFDRLVAVARELAQGLDGVLVDDQHHPLPDQGLAGIRAQVAQIQATMAQCGLPAGGRRALRLFV